jgi:hypothetical protein
VFYIQKGQVWRGAGSPIGQSQTEPAGQVERFFNKIKHFRAIATRYDKLATNFIAAVQLVSAIILLN